MIIRIWIGRALVKQLGGSWKRQIVVASVEGFGGGIWWRKMVEALVEGSGTDEVRVLV